MNLQAGGLVLIVLVGLLCTLLYKRRQRLVPGNAGPFWTWLAKLFKGVDEANDDPVEMAALALIAASRVSNKVLYAPSYLWFQCDQATGEFLRSSPAGMHAQLVSRTNELGQHEAGRRGLTWNPVRGITMNYPIALGSNAVKVSFAPFENSPFASSTPQLANEPDFAAAVEFTKWNTEEPAERPAGTPEPKWTMGTIPPRLREPNPRPSVTVTALIAGNAPRQSVVRLAEGATSFQVGRDPACELVLPTLPGISAKHLLVTVEGGKHYATDMSTHGSWVETEWGWQQLPTGQKTLIQTGSRLLLDADQQVVLSLSEGAQQ